MKREKEATLLSKIRDIGLFFFLGGLLILLVYGAGLILSASETPLIIRLGVLAMLMGVVILITTLIKEQYIESDDSPERG
jgi:hypothetical protein